VTQTWLLVLGLITVFAGLLLMLTTFGTLTTERQAVARSLAAVEAVRVAPESMRAELEPPFGQRVVGPLFQRLVRLGHRFTPADRTDRLRRRLDLAGNPAGWDVDRVLAYKALGLILLGAAGALLPLVFGNVLWALLFGVGGALLGFWLPNIVLYEVSDRRSQAIQKALPDALDLLMISVEAGLAFDAALAQVARNTRGPLAEEFFRVLQEMQIGTGRVNAMRALADRTDVDDLRTFVTAMVQADAFGIPIANVLRTQAKEMRIRRSQRAEERAQKVPVKMLFPLIFFIMPSLFIVVLGPAAITIMKNFSGLGS